MSVNRTFRIFVSSTFSDLKAEHNALQARVFPRLRFHWDPTPENADHMEKLFKQLREERQE